jgi:PAS domain S-box-containing protein
MDRWRDRMIIAGFGIILMSLLGVNAISNNRFWGFNPVMLWLTAVWFGMALLIQLNWDNLRQRFPFHQPDQGSLTSESLFHRAIQDAPVPIMLHAEDGEVLLISRAWTELTGYDSIELPTIADWTQRAYGSQLQAAVEANIARLYQLEQSIYEGGFAITTRQGETRIWSFYSSPLGTLPDNRRIVSSVAIDITENNPVREALSVLREEVDRRVAERTAQLEQANAALETFSRTVAHDLSAPLRTMQSFAQILLQDHAGSLDATEQAYIQRINDTAQRTEQFIRDLLVYSRLDRASLPLQPINLSSIVAQVLTDLEEPLRRQQAEVRVDEPLAIVLGHPTALSQVISNLLTNAIKFVAADVQPQIWIGTESVESGRTVRLTVQDNGIGIAPDQQALIFQVFERLYPAEMYPGSGIGLAIVKRAVERMGGQVGLESQPGVGSRFWIEIPLATAQRQAIVS